MPCNVLVAVRKPELAGQIRDVLVARGYRSPEACLSGAQALRSAATHAIDIALIGFTMPDMPGLELARNLLEQSDCSVLLLTPADQVEYVKRQIGALDIVPLQMPATAQAMLDALDLMQHYRSRVQAAEGQARKLRESLERRAIAEKAQAVLMKNGMSEAESWRYLQKRAMDTGRTLKSVAEQVLKSQ